MKKVLLFISLVLLEFVGLNQNSYAQNRVFKIGSESLFPFEYQEDSRARGINIQLIDTIFKRLDIPYEIVFGTEDDRALDKIKRGEIDAILSISYTKERLSYLWFPEGFENANEPQNFMWSSEYVFFCKKGKESVFTNLSTLKEFADKNVIVGVIDGVSYSNEFWNSGIKVIKHSHEDDNFYDLEQGKVDFVLTDKTLGRFMLKKLNLEDEIIYIPQKWISKPYTMGISRKSNHPQIEIVKKRFFEELEWAKKSGLARKMFMFYLQQIR